MGIACLWNVVVEVVAQPCVRLSDITKSLYIALVLAFVRVILQNQSVILFFGVLLAKFIWKTEYKSRFLVKFGQRIKAIPVEQIAYFFSQDKLTYLVTFEGKKLPLDQPLEELEGLINPKNYFRVNRKYIVHFDAVSDIHPYFKGRVKLQLEPDAQDDIVISSEKTPLFKQWLDS